MSNTNDEASTLVEAIRTAERILVIVGAGLSRPSGLPTFREDPGFWGNRTTQVLTKSTFDVDPISVWCPFERLRQLALLALPNCGHIALAELARAKPGVLTISQNIDDLLRRAGHEESQLVDLHGPLFMISCSHDACSFNSQNMDAAPTVPGLVIASWDATDPSIVLPHLSSDDVPRCPCGSGILRPGVCWYGERLPKQALQRINDWFESATYVDLVLVVGTDRAPYLQEAEAAGADIAFFNISEDDLEADMDAWIINDDASNSLPALIGAALGLHIRSTTAT